MEIALGTSSFADIDPLISLNGSISAPSQTLVAGLHALLAPDTFLYLAGRSPYSAFEGEWPSPSTIVSIRAVQAVPSPVPICASPRVGHKIPWPPLGGYPNPCLLPSRRQSPQRSKTAAADFDRHRAFPLGGSAFRPRIGRGVGSRRMNVDGLKDWFANPRGDSKQGTAASDPCLRRLCCRVSADARNPALRIRGPGGD